MAKPILIFGLAQSLYDNMVKIFKRYDKIDKVLLFGSRAKGTAKPYSDFDLAILAPEMSGKEFALLWSEINDLPIIFKLDVVHWNRLNNRKFKEKILNEGKNFYPLPDHTE
ncbi:hypothetical protein BH10PSE19_BH10PSE19_22580 [soil metagenome]